MDTPPPPHSPISPGREGSSANSPALSVKRQGTLRGLLTRVSSMTRVGVGGGGGGGGSGAEISEPEHHKADAVAPVMPDEVTVNRRYDEVARQLGLPAQSNLSCDNKWKIVWNYERSHDQLGQPEDYAKTLASTASRPAEQFQIVGVAGLGSRPPAWLERFANAQGTQSVLLILQRLLANPDPRMVAEAIADCTRALRELVKTTKGREALQEPKQLCLVLRALEYVNILAQLSIVRFILDICSTTAGFVAAFYALDTPSTGGATHWQRIIGLLDRENGDLRVSVVQLCDIMLSQLNKPELSSMPDRLRNIFMQCDLPAILTAFTRSSEDDRLLSAISDFRAHHPAFAIEESDPWAPRRAKATAASAFKALQDNLVIPGSCWEIIARFLSLAAATPPSEWEAKFSQEGGSRASQFPSIASLDGDLNALLESERGPAGSSKSDFEQLKRKYDDLFNSVDVLKKAQRTCEKCGGKLMKRKKKRKPQGVAKAGDGTAQDAAEPAIDAHVPSDSASVQEPSAQKKGHASKGGRNKSRGGRTGGDGDGDGDGGGRTGGGGGGSGQGTGGSGGGDGGLGSGASAPGVGDGAPVSGTAGSEESSEEDKPKRATRKKRTRRPKKLLANLPPPSPISNMGSETVPATEGTVQPAAVPLAPPPPEAVSSDGDSGPPPPPPPPPPPMGDNGGGPPPPPPPPGLAVAVPAKPKLKPRIKMRGLPWKHLTYQQARGTLFEGLNEESIVAALPLDELESLFGVVAASSSQADGTTASETPSSAREISLLGGKRSDNVTIALSKFKELAFSQIREALVTCDLETLPLERLMLLKPILPTPDELKALEPYAEDRNRLARPERFFLELSKIPRLTQRFQSLVYTLTYEEKYVALDRTVTNVLHAVQALRESQKLKQLVEIMLGVGNYLNGGSFRGGAWGFKLSTVSELMSFKTNAGKPMMEFLVSFCRDRYPDVLSWTREVEIVSLVAMVNTKYTVGEVAELAKGMEVVEEELEHPAADLDDDGLPELLDEFHEQADPLCSALEDRAVKMQADFDSLVQFFGEEKMESEEFFGLFASWIHAFQGTERNLRLASEKQKKTGAAPMLVAELQARQKAGSK